MKLRLSLKAVVVCLLGVGAMSTQPSSAAGESGTWPCGEMWCIQGGCPLDPVAWCAGHGAAECQGPKVCDGFAPCPPQFDAAVTCGDAES